MEKTALDTAVTGGVGGKANTLPGKNTAHFQGPRIITGKNDASRRGIKPGEEIFVDYGEEYTLSADEDFVAEIDGEFQGWYFVRRGRLTKAKRRAARRPPTPLRGGEGGNSHAGDRVFQHVAGVSNPT